MLSIWKARKLKLWQQVSDSSVTILERAKHLLEGSRNANHKKSHVSQNHTVSITSIDHQDHDHSSGNKDIDIRWRKPRSGKFKCNIDVSFSNSSNKVGLGMCIRDSAWNHVCSKLCGSLHCVQLTLGRPKVYIMQFGGYFIGQIMWHIVWKNID